MSARYAVLGMLRDGPAYPYQLAARIHDLLGPRFDINTGQMSSLTRALTDSELIELVAEPAQPASPAGRRTRTDRRVYAITEKGAAEFDRFFERGANETKLVRRTLLVKLALAGPERLGEVMGQIETYEQHCTDRINELSRRLEPMLPDDHLRPRVDRVVLRLGVEADISQLRAELGWARHAREMASWLLRSDAIWPAAPAPPAAAADPARVERDDARRQMLDRLAARNRDEPC